MPKNAGCDIVLKKPAYRCAGAIFAVSSLFPVIYNSTSIIADIYSRLCR